MDNKISKIAVFTSGGDAPGMNAALRAVVRAAIYYKKEVYGIMRGYEGMIDGDIVKLGARSVGNILQRGGTILKTARSEAFRTKDGREKAFQNLKKTGIDGLVAIGGDGSFTGLHKFNEEYKIPAICIICIPGTIDNDLACTDFTIGFDTATNTAVEAIDKIRDTALSHNRLFFIEVMGRNAGHIAINCGVSGGAVATIIPEESMTIEELFDQLDKGEKTSSLVVVAEGSKLGGALELARKFSERNNYFDIKVTILGHLQRGGAPTYFDRVLASKMGVAAVEGLLKDQNDVMVGIRDNQIVFNPYDAIVSQHHKIDSELIRIAKILSI